VSVPCPSPYIPRPLSSLPNMFRRRSRIRSLILIALEEDDDEHITFRNRLTAEGRRRRQRRIPRSALQSPHLSAFAVMLGSGNDQSLITACGLDHRAFRELLILYSPFYQRYSPYSVDGRLRRVSPDINGGRPRTMTAEHSLGLYLMWLRSRGPESFLCMIFGVSASVGSLFIRFARRIILRILYRDTRAAVRMPLDTDIPLLQARSLRIERLRVFSSW